MHPAAILLGAVMVLFTLPLLWMYSRLMSIRRSFDIAARSPVLLVCAGVGSLVVANVVLLHRALLIEHEGLSCRGTFWVSYFWFAFSCVPFGLRALRLVVLYHTEYRVKFARFVKWKVLTRAWAVLVLAIAVHAVVVFVNLRDRYARGNYGCFFFNEKLVLEVGLGTSCIPAIYLMYKLLQVDDAFGIKPEIVCVITSMIMALVLEITTLELVNRKILQDSHAIHLAMDLVVLAVTLNILLWSAVVPLAAYDHWCGYQGAKSALVLPKQGGGGTVRAYIADGNDGVYEYAMQAAAERRRGYGGPDGATTVAGLFAEFCRRSLVMEGWEFILECIAYKEVTNPMEEQFAAFTAIFEKYLKPTSPQEVNISSSMQRSMAAFCDREKFAELDECSRQMILDPPMREIVRMLDQNLNSKFKQTPAMRRRLESREREELAMEQARGDKEMQLFFRSVSGRSPTI